ncbi:MAG: Beta-hexosaminidase [Verrucomicrobiae bacterium]|nr:Beta-hexosaminidase [Verrucomicrobiae bacterium]
MKTPAYRNHKLPLAQRVASLIAQMTLAEKVSQMVHAAPAIERLGLPEYNWWNECLHGVARAGKATVFPQAMGMAASFHTDLVNRVATAISDEARAKHNAALRQGNRGMYFGLTYWTPNINLFRDPRWGRGQETYGECPYLTARLGVAFIKGLQGNHPQYLKLVATAKHYAVHSGPEESRHRFNAVVSQRDLRESYLPHFQAAVQEAKVHSLMGAYNRVNGEPCNGSVTLLQKILRDEWGFTGYVVSDCYAIKDFHQGHGVTKDGVESAALAARNGCDINCGCLFLELAEAVKRGLVTEAELDRNLTRLFTARFRLGMFDPPARVPWSKLKPAVVNSPAHRKLARRMAQESIVLLKNDGVLPLRKDLRQILVVGPNAVDTLVLLGNYNGFAPQMTTLLAGIVGKVATGTQVQWAKGCELAGDHPINTGELHWLTSYGPPVDVIVACLGYSATLEGEEGSTEGGGSGDRNKYGLPGRQQEFLEALTKFSKPIVLVVTGGSPIDLTWAQAHCAAIVWAGYPGEQGGDAVADVLFGDYNPAGRLPITFPKSYDQLPAFEDYNMRGHTYRFMDAEPLYRFGYGLSYTTFRYSKLKIRGLTVSVAVKNAGRLAGDEVVQLYIRDIVASVPVPRRHLAGFRRIHLKPGQTATVTFPLRREQFACFDDAGQPFLEPGDFEISVGGGQPDDPHSGAVTARLALT